MAGKRLPAKTKGALNGQAQSAAQSGAQGSEKGKFGAMVEEAEKASGAGLKGEPQAIIATGDMTGKLPDPSGTPLPENGKVLPELTATAISTDYGGEAMKTMGETAATGPVKSAAQPIIAAEAQTLVVNEAVNTAKAISSMPLNANQKQVIAEPLDKLAKPAAKAAKTTAALPQSLKEAFANASNTEQRAFGKGAKELDNPLAAPIPPLTELTSAIPQDVTRGDVRLEVSTALGGVKETAAAQSDRAKDFDAIVDRLVQAREQAQGSGPVSLSMKHGEFGSVNLRFEQTAAGLSVAMSSLDPDFATAAQNAMAERVNAAENATSSDNNTQRRDAESNQNGQYGQNGGSLAGSHQHKGESAAFARRVDHSDPKLSSDDSEGSREAELIANAEQSRRAASGLYI